MTVIKSTGDTKSYKISTRLLMQEALRAGYSVQYFPNAPSAQSGIVRCTARGKELFFKSTCTALTPSYGVHAAENKYLTYSLLTGHGVRTPKTVALTVDDHHDVALSMMKESGIVVVKPAASNHGDGVTTDVKTVPGLKRAIQFARRACGPEDDIIVQKQVKGSEYRFLVVQGKVAAVAHRRPPFVVGDGSSTVQQLIAQKNQDPRRGKGHESELTVVDLDDVRHHKGKEFLRKVLPRGQKANVLETSNLSRGGESIDFTNTASRALKKMAVAAAQNCFLGIAGVDIITPDIAADTDKDSYVIEVNLAPGIRMHQYPTEGKARDVAAVIFAAIEKTARPVGGYIHHVGRVERVSFPDFNISKIPSRIDTGATVSSVWVSKVKETASGLSFTFFDKTSDLYTGETIVVPEYSKRAVTSSMGQVQVRYQIKTPLIIAGRKVISTFTLADRSTQAYPVLIGRNVLRKKFIVDVSSGRVSKQEKVKRKKLDDMLKRGEL